MPNNNYFKRIVITDIFPPLWEVMAEMHANCLARGVQYWATSGYRSWEEQDRLYAQGRTTPGDIVTKARGGESAHNYRIAVDWTFDADTTRDGLQPEWKPEQYVVLAEEAGKLGLDAGMYWKFKDCPHVQLSLWSNCLVLKDLRIAHTAGGDGGVGRVLNKYIWF